jgi:hypothetical protein
MPVAFLLGVISQLMPITKLDQQPSKLRDHTHLLALGIVARAVRLRSVKARKTKQSKTTFQCLFPAADWSGHREGEAAKTVLQKLEEETRMSNKQMAMQKWTR